MSGEIGTFKRLLRDEVLCLQDGISNARLCPLRYAMRLCVKQTEPIPACL